VQFIQFLSSLHTYNKDAVFRQ